MNGKLMKLGLAAIVALILAFWIGNAREPRTSSAGAGAVAPGLKDAINDVRTVHVIGAESKPLVTLVKGADGWTVREKSGYPADFAKVREFLLELAEADLVEPKTANVASFAKLGVEDVAAKDAKGALVEIEGPKALVRIIIGNFNGRGGDGTFVRRAGEPQSWLASGNLTVDRVAANWLRRELADVPSSRIEEVAIVTDGKTLRVFKTEAAEPNYQVANLPKGRELSSEFAANALASVLAGLRFDDVSKDADIEPGAKAHEIRYASFDGLVVTARAWEAGDKDYARFAAALDEARANAAIDAEQARAKSAYETAKLAVETRPAAAPDAKTETGTNAKADAVTGASGAEPTPAAAPEAAPTAPPLAVSDPARDRSERIAKLRAEVAALEKKFQGWTYVLPSYKYANMNKSVEDMLKPPAAKK